MTPLPSYGVDEETMKSSSRGVTNEPRDVAMHLARTIRGDSLNHIAAEFQIEKYSTVASAISRIKMRIEADKGLADRVERSKREIEKRQRKT
ncbi:helix-turn-helix domain-containing protein [Desulfomicrobium salsuginis]